MNPHPWRIPKPLLRPDEAAAILTISPRTLWTLTDSGKIRCVRLGRSVRYDVCDLERAIKEMKTPTTELNQIHFEIRSWGIEFRVLKFSRFSAKGVKRFLFPRDVEG